MKQLRWTASNGLLTPLMVFLLVVGSFLFVEVNYRYLYHFMEQYMMFRYEFNYFRDLLITPGGWNEYVTEFLSQAFYFPFGASVVISLSVGTIAGLFLLFLRKCGIVASAWAGLLPAFWYWLFPVESIYVLWVVITALAWAISYSSVTNRKMRYVLGLLLPTACYAFAAPAHLLMVVFILAYEWSKAEKRQDYFFPLSGLAWVLALPFIAMRTVYVVSMREAFLSKYIYNPANPIPSSFWLLLCVFPVLLCIAYALRNNDFAKPSAVRRWVSPVCLLAIIGVGIWKGGHPMEQVYRYDYDARAKRWNQIVDHALAHGIRDKDALIYANWASAETGRFNELLLRFPQIGEEGFIPYMPASRLAMIEASEIAWYLNHVNTAQRLAFEGMMSSQRGVHTRLMQRLVESYIVNGEYQTAEKYIRLFDETLLYKQWAKEQRALLSDAASAQAGWVVEKRAKRPTTNNIYDLTKIFPSTLAFLLDDHWNNREAMNYAMGYVLIYKDFAAFLHYMERLRQDGQSLPVLYQEALCLIYATMRNNPEEFRQYAIDPKVYERFVSFIQSAQTLSPSLLRQQFGNTYYYYAQYIDAPKPVQR